MQQHEKIIRDVAKEILAPEGLFQVGRSRAWIDDNEFFVVQVWFQASGYSKSSSLMAGVSFLWEIEQEDLLDGLVYGDGYYIPKLGYTVKYSDGHEESFREKIKVQAEFAIQKVFEFRKLNDYEYAEKCLQPDYIPMQYYHLAMLNFYFNQFEKGKTYFQKFLENVKECEEVEPEYNEWRDSVYNYCVNDILPKITDAGSAKNVVDEIIRNNREYLMSRPSYKKMARRSKEKCNDGKET